MIIPPYEESSSSLSFDESAVLVGTPKQKTSYDNNANLERFFQKPPDVKIVVEGIEFPCHYELLSNRSTILRDILLVNGIQKQVSKKQRAHGQERGSSTPSTLPPPSVITVAELKVDAKIFRALLEFLYTNELSDALYWEDVHEELPLVSDDEDSDDLNDSRAKLNGRENSSRSIYHAMRFLKRLLIAADRFGVVPLKYEIEYKLYDEFLFSFTSADLYVWADSKSCAFLKEKAMDRICKKSGSVDDFVISKDGWRMIRASKRLSGELFVYAREGWHAVRYFKDDGLLLNHESEEHNYYNVEYLRMRLSYLGLDIVGTREMLEGRLRPHLDMKHQHFLPTRLTKASEMKNRHEQDLYEWSHSFFFGASPLP